MLVNLQYLTLATLVNLEFGWVKYWQMAFRSPNSSKFSLAKIFCYMVFVNSVIFKSFQYFISLILDSHTLVYIQM